VPTGLPLATDTTADAGKIGGSLGTFARVRRRLASTLKANLGSVGPRGRDMPKPPDRDQGPSQARSIRA
jgi:hypothetical protein